MLFVWSGGALAQSGLAERCPASGIVPRGAAFQPGGIILTSFDGLALWVYDIERATRYPLPETRPCSAGCHLSPDANWITYFDPTSLTFGRMRLDGTRRTPIAGNVSDVRWWSAERFLVWTPDHRAYLRPVDASAPREALPVRNVISVQPGGRWALMLQRAPEAGFQRALVDLRTRDDPEQPERRIPLALDEPFFNAAAWSPTGEWLAYVARGAYDESAQTRGAELFLIRPGDALPRQATFLAADYGAVRINGQLPHALSWSPDGTRLAFWVAELFGPNVEANLGQAAVHVLNVQTGEVVRYCGVTTSDHTPNTPPIVWSPDGSHLAFAVNVPGDDKGHLLLALRLSDGQLIELSDGAYPFGNVAQVYAWGNRP